MGHVVNYDIQAENVNRKKVQAYWDDYAAREDWQEGCSGLATNIRWIERKICEDEESARDYISENDNGWYDQLAVRFYDYPKLKESKKYSDLKERLSKAEKELYALENTKYTETLTKTEFVGCKCCGSKISVKHFKGSYCPVCRADMRPKSTLDRIERMKEKNESLKKDLKTEEKKLQEKQKKNAKIKWLIKIEYHV